MLPRRPVLKGALLVASLAVLPLAGAAAADPLKAVASFSILGDMVHEIGGDRVAVTTLVGPDGDAHVYQPTPADAAALASADILFTNGLGFEGWMDRLKDSAEYKGTVVVATAGLSPLPGEDEEHEHGHDEEHAHDDDHAHVHVHEHEHEHEHAEDGGHHHHHGAYDPHAWQSLANARIYARNIAAGLIVADPAGKNAYEANLVRYLAEINAVETEVVDTIEALPEDHRRIITSHDAFGYFGHDYGLTFLAPQGISTEAEAGAGSVAGLIRQIRAEKVPAIFVENIADPRLLKQIADETGAKIGGTLYSDALSAADGPAPTYLDMMRHNIRTLAAALDS